MMPRARERSFVVRDHRRCRVGWLCLLVVSPILCPFLRAAPADPAPPADPADPAAELSTFQVAEGFEVNLFASEKDGVIKPIQIRFDERGRIWVIGSSVYPQLQPGQTPDDKVLILEDQDGDGRADKTTIFARGLMIPTGLELGDGGAYVGHGTELLFLKDTDGDGQADERRVLLRGFGTGDNHQNLNSFRWSPGGELWMCQGLHTFSNVETPWGLVRLHQAGLWRFRPRLMKLEGFYGSAYEPQNPWGYVFTDWGEPIVIAGNNSSSIYPVPGLTSRHRDDPPALIWKNGQGRKSSGGEIVGTAHFPNDWQGLLILGGYINNAVWALKLTEDGAGFALEDRPPLIRSTSRSFRPVDAKFGPDGALYLADWYNPIIGHYQASFRHPDRDKSHGRIWRVTAKGRSLTPRPRLAGASTAQLLEDLKSPDRWTRQFAKRVLADRPAAEVTNALDTWLAAGGLSELALVEALGVYRSHESPAPMLLERLTRATEPGARAYAASTVGAWADRLPDPLTLLGPLIIDAHPRVRLHALVAASYVSKLEAITVAMRASDLAMDNFLDYAFRQTVFALKPQWLPALQAGHLQLENPGAHLAALVRADGTPDTVQAVRALLAGPTLSPSRRLTLCQLLAEVGDAEDLARLLDPGLLGPGSSPTDHTEVLRALAGAARQREVRPAGNTAAALTTLWQTTSNEGLQVSILKLAAQWRVPFLDEPQLSAVVRTPNHPDLNAAGAMALATLASANPDAKTALLQFAKADRPPTERAAAAIGLIHLDLPKAAETAAGVLATDDAGKFAAAALTPFLSRQGGLGVLATALEKNPPTRDAARIALRLLVGSGKEDGRLQTLLLQSARLGVDSAKLTPAQLQEFIQEVRQQGNAARGEEVFRRPEVGCLTCHSVQGRGGSTGPDLSALGTAQSIEFIVGAILEPQKEIKEGFSAITVSTRDGEDFPGYLIRESPTELVLRDVLRNREVRLAKATIQQRQTLGSIMPSGLTDALTRAEFRDLVRYLSELGRPK